MSTSVPTVRSDHPEAANSPRHAPSSTAPSTPSVPPVDRASSSEGVGPMLPIVITAATPLAATTVAGKPNSMTSALSPSSSPSSSSPSSSPHEFAMPLTSSGNQMTLTVPGSPNTIAADSEELPLMPAPLLLRRSSSLTVPQANPFLVRHNTEERTFMSALSSVRDMPSEDAEDWKVGRHSPTHNVALNFDAHIAMNG
jgi:hypothetical protein